MRTSETSNAITQRLDKMNQLWEAFRSLPDARICRWLVREDEKRMMNVFIESSYLESNSLEDLFIPFYTDCFATELYSADLIAELDKQFMADKEAMESEGIYISWRPGLFQEGRQRQYFTDNLVSLSKEFPAAGLLVAVLMPPAINRFFIEWLGEMPETRIPGNIRLLVMEIEGDQKLDELQEAWPALMKTENLELDMPAAMRQLAAAGDAADPGVKFRKAFLELSQAASSKNIAKVEKLEVIPLNMAREHSWVNMEIAVHSLVGSAYVGARQFDAALKKYNAAFELAKAAMGSGDKAATPLAIQSLFNKGSVHIARKKYEDAARAFDHAAQYSKTAGDNFQLMEARRMQGFCLEKNGDWKQAFEVEKEALTAAEQLDESLRHNSTLPYLAQSLLELSYRNGDKEDYILLEEKINALAGPGWQSKLPLKKQVVT